MTETDKKRERNNGNEKTPAPSPNRRNTKTQRQETMASEAGKKDVVMTEVQQKDGPVSNLNEKFKGATNDWKKRIKAGISSGWEITLPPPPSRHWDNLSATKKKDTEGFLAEDLKQSKWPLLLKDGWKDLKFLYQLDEKRHTGRNSPKASNKTRTKSYSENMLRLLNVFWPSRAPKPSTYQELGPEQQASFFRIQL
jgi:hypothetical protein